MKSSRVIIKSHSFKWLIVVTILFIVSVYAVNKIVDSVIVNKAGIPLSNLGKIYKPPKGYDDYERINLMLLNKKYLAIEGNKRFRISGSQKYVDYYDTISIKFPENTSELMDSVYIDFINSDGTDTILLNITKSSEPGIYWYQVFYTTVIIENLNSFSSNPEAFRIEELLLADPKILKNNDTLINDAVRKYEIVKKLNFDCGFNSNTFKAICDSLYLPCRTIGLQGGDAKDKGYDSILGYPIHAVCEIYSSHHKKWYVIDPTFGYRFKSADSGSYLNAAEIQDIYYTGRENIILQDSILSTYKNRAGSDYFKFYENIYFSSGINFSEPWLSLIIILYKRFQFYQYHYTKNLLPEKNGFYYIIMKSMVYICLTFLYFIILLLILTRRLFSVYKSKV